MGHANFECAVEVCALHFVKLDMNSTALSNPYRVLRNGCLLAQFLDITIWASVVVIVKDPFKFSMILFKKYDVEYI